MTVTIEPPCWAVVAQLPASLLRDVVLRQWKHDVPYSFDPPPWQVVEGSGDYNAVLSHLPGTLGSDRTFAALLSQLAKDKRACAIWFDPEMPAVFAWESGEQVQSRQGDPMEAFESFGFSLSRPAPVRQTWSVGYVEHASANQLRQALATLDPDTWLHFESNANGIVMTAKDGSPGIPAWEASEALPEATVYHLNRGDDPEALHVIVLRNGVEIGAFQVSLSGEEEGLLPDVKGERTVQGILSKLGIPPRYLGYRGVE